MAAQKHVHRYVLKDLSRNPEKGPFYVYACTKVDCTHWIRFDLAEGKLAECNKCEQPFIMEAKRLKKGQYRVKHPICRNCKVKKSNSMAQVDELIKSLGL